MPRTQRVIQHDGRRELSRRRSTARRQQPCSKYHHSVVNTTLMRKASRVAQHRFMGHQSVPLHICGQQSISFALRARQYNPLMNPPRVVITHTPRCCSLQSSKPQPVLYNKPLPWPVEASTESRNPACFSSTSYFPLQCFYVALKMAETAAKMRAQLELENSKR